MKIVLKKFNRNDYYFIFNLRNSKTVRLSSLNTKEIKYTEHLRWLKGFLKKKRVILIIKTKNIKIGYIRLEKKYKKIFISIALIKKYRGKGLGKKALVKAEKFISNEHVYSFVLRNNLQSIALFKSTNYNIYKYYKKYFLMKKKIIRSSKYIKIINKIEKVRKKNNSNWMNILKIAFRHDPISTGKEMAKIYGEDKKISSLSKKLSE